MDQWEIFEKGSEKMNEKVYTTNLIVRMTDKEKREVARAASKRGISMSELVRICVLKPPEVSRKEFNTLKRMINYEIRKIGVNVNQIAKKYNEYSYVEPSLDLLSKLNQIIELMYEINGRIDNKT